MRCYDDEQCSIPRARSSLFAKKCSSVDHAMVHMGGLGVGGWGVNDVHC